MLAAPFKRDYVTIVFDGPASAFPLAFAAAKLSELSTMARPIALDNVVPGDDAFQQFTAFDRQHPRALSAARQPLGIVSTPAGRGAIL